MNKNKESRKEEIKYRGLELLSLFVFGVLILFLILINFDVAGLESYRDLYGDFYGMKMLTGNYLVKSDSLKDYGKIEFSPDNGSTWIDIINDTAYSSSISWYSAKPILTGNSGNFYSDNKTRK